jgi:predicted dehydrogenase
MPVKIGVIGTGHLGNIHTKLLQQIPECELVGIYDKNPEQAATVAQSYGIPAFPTVEALLEQVDAVSIATITSAHHEIGKICLEHNKHVIVEKPITVTIPEAEELVALAAERHLILQVGHIERFNPALLSLEHYLLEPLFIQSDRLAQFNPRGTDVAVVLDLMIHDIDIILSLVKSEVTHIEASGVPVVSGTVDIANARIEFANGAVANVTASRISQKKLRKMRLFQRDGYIALDFTTGVSEVFRLLPGDAQLNEGTISFGELGVGERKKKVVYEQPESKDINALQYELSLFVKAVAEGTQPVVSGADGLRALKVANEIVKKIEESAQRVLASHA